MANVLSPPSFLLASLLLFSLGLLSLLQASLGEDLLQVLGLQHQEQQGWGRALLQVKGPPLLS